MHEKQLGGFKLLRPLSRSDLDNESPIGCVDFAFVASGQRSASFLSM